MLQRIESRVSERHLQTQAQGSILCKSPKVEISPSVPGRVTGGTACGTSMQRIRASLKKEGNSDTCDTGEPWEHDAKWNTPVTERHRVHDSTNSKYLEELNLQRRKEGGLPGAGRERGMEICCFMSIKFELCKIQRVLELHWSCATMWKYFIVLNLKICCVYLTTIFKNGQRLEEVFLKRGYLNGQHACANGLSTIAS